MILNPGHWMRNRGSAGLCLVFVGGEIFLDKWSRHYGWKIGFDGLEKDEDGGWLWIL